MVDAGDFAGAKVAHLVALYRWCHERVYEVDPEELTGETWVTATKCAGQLVRNAFGGDLGAAIDFLRWTWRREEGREKWRRENGRDGRRITWRDQFAAKYLITDYRLARARDAERGRTTG